MGGCLQGISGRSILSTSKPNQSTAIEFGLFYVTMHIGALLGPLTYLWLTDKNMIQFSFSISALLYTLFLLSSAIWLKPNKLCASIPAIQFKDILSVFSIRPFMIYCVLITGVWFILSQLYVFFPLQLLHRSHGEKLIAYLNSWNAILIIFIQYFCSSVIANLNIADRFNLMALGVMLMGVGWFFCIYQESNYMLYFAIGLFTLGEILFIGVVDLLAVTFAPDGQDGLYLGFSIFTWAIGGAAASIVGSFSYGYLAAYQHIELFWIGILILSLFLGVAILANKNRLLHVLSPIPQLYKDELRYE